MAEPDVVPSPRKSPKAAPAASSPVLTAKEQKRKVAAESEVVGVGGRGSVPTRKKKKKKRRDEDDEEEEPEAPETSKVPTVATAVARIAESTERTVFVDGVPYIWTVEKVREHFESCGNIVEVRAPTWQDSGRLRGFAHITFETEKGRNKALKMDGTTVGTKGRYLKIDAAQVPKAASETSSSRDVSGFRRLFVKNLPYDATETELNKLFGDFGKIEDVRIATSFGRSKGFAYVEFAKSAFLQKAVETKPWPTIRGRALVLDADTGKGPKAGFHYRTEAYDASGKFMGRGGGAAGGRGASGGRGKGGGKSGDRKLSLF